MDQIVAAMVSMWGFGFVCGCVISAVIFSFKKKKAQVQAPQQ